MDISPFVKKQVLAVLQYGSSINGTAHAYSDIDVCIVTTFAIREQKRRLGAFLTDKNYDIKFFDELPIILKMDVMRQHRALYLSDEDALFEHFLFWARVYDHFVPYYYRAKKTLRERLKQWKSRKRLKSDAI